MKIGNTNNKEIKADLRFDGSFHLSDAVLYEKIIKKNSYIPLSELVIEIFTSGRSKRIYTNKEFGYPYLSNSDVVSQNPLSSCKYVSKKYGSDERSLLKVGMILTGRVGAIGQTAYVSPELQEKKALGSDNIIRIVPKNMSNWGYLYAYFVSKYGNTFLWKLASGGVQPYISEPSLYNLPIPLLSKEKQQQTHELIVKASELRVEANNLLEEFRKELIQRFHVSLQKQRVTSKNVLIDDILNHKKRFDASFYATEGRRIYDLIKNQGHLTIGELSKVVHPIIFGKKRIKGIALKGNPLYKSSSMMLQTPQSDFWLSKKKKNKYSQLMVKEKYVMVSRTGTVGNIAYISKRLSGIYIDDHMIRIIPFEKHSGIVFIFLTSSIGKELISFQKYGSVQHVINSENIERIPIPNVLLDKSFLTKTEEGVRNSFEKIDLASHKENQAIELIENEISSWQK